MEIGSLKKKLRDRKRERERGRQRELQKPSWFEINRKEIEELTRDIYNNQNNNKQKNL